MIMTDKGKPGHPGNRSAIAAVTTEQRADDALERSNAYGFLSAMFSKELSKERLETLRSPVFFNALTSSVLLIGHRFCETPIDELVEDLSVEFARLFLVPGNERIPPYESIHIPDGSGLLAGVESQQVKAYITAAGFKYNDSFKDIADHISVELEFMSHLVQIESISWQNADIISVRNSLEYQSEFFCQHIDRWAFSFFDKVANTTRHNFYYALAVFARCMLEKEASTIDKALSETVNLASMD